jgi:hypothetical protein
MGMQLLLLAVLAASAPVHARDPRLCLGLRVPMSDAPLSELSEAAKAVIDRFARGSPLENPTARNALRDPRVRFAVLATYGSMRGYQQNLDLSLERGEAIRSRMIQQGISADRIHVIGLVAAFAYSQRAGLVPTPGEGRNWGYVIIEYPEARECTPA